MTRVGEGGYGSSVAWALRSEAKVRREDDGRIVLDAGDGDDEIRIRDDTSPAARLGGGGAGVIVEVNGQSYRFTREEAERLVLRGGSGDDRLVNETDVGVTLEGGSGDDDLVGGRGDDVLRGGSGDDRLRGGGGDDRVRGGGGDDRVRGGSGRDRADGGRDRARTEPGERTRARVREVRRDQEGPLRGEPLAIMSMPRSGREAQITQSKAGDIFLDAGDGDDAIRVRDGRDGEVVVDVNGEEYRFSREQARRLLVRGGDGDDRVENETDVGMILQGEGGSDVVEGGAGGDVIQGGAGDDRLVGGAGDDFVEGGAGRDRVDGGGGNDRTWHESRPRDFGPGLPNSIPARRRA